MSTLGTVVLKLETQHAQLQVGLKETRAEMKQTQESAKGLTGSLKGMFAGIAIGAGIAMLHSMAEATIKNTTEAYRLSGALGITTGSLQELQTAGLLKAGLSAEEFNKTFKHMLKGLGEAAEGTGPATEALTRLGLTGKELAGQKTDQVFKTIAQKISETKEPLAQSKAALALFGKEGQNLLPLFLEGAAGIEEAAAKARKFGVSMSDVDAAKLVNANEKFEEIGLAATGVENTLTVALAPVLSEIADKVLDIIPAADTMRNGFITGMKAVASGVGYLIDAYKVLKVGIMAVGYGGVAAIEGIVYVIKKLADGIVWVHNKLFSSQWGTPAFVTDSLKTVDDWRKSMGEQIKEAWDQPSAVDKVNGFFDNIQTKANETAKKMADHKKDMAEPLAEGFGEAKKKIDEILKAMEDEVNNFGLTEAEKKVNELKSLHARPEDIAKAQDAADTLKVLEAGKKLQDDANSLIKEAQNPLDKYQERLGELDAMVKGGYVNQKQYAAGIAKANEDLRGSFKDDQGKKTGAETRRFDFAGPSRETPHSTGIQLLADVAKKQAADVKQSKDYLAEIYRFQNNADQGSDQVVEWN